MNPSGPSTMTKEDEAALFARVEERLKEAKRYVMGFVILDVAETETLRALAQAGRDDPEMDATDFAHPAWWRGEERAFSRACEHVNAILDGRDAGHGTSREPWHSTRQRLVALAQANTGERYRRMEEQLRACQLLSGDAIGDFPEGHEAFNAFVDIHSAAVRGLLGSLDVVNEASQAKGGGKDLGDEPYDSQPADMRAVVEALGFEPDNHHNALMCPYCNPTGLKFAPPSPPSPSPWPLRYGPAYSETKHTSGVTITSVSSAPSPWPSEEQIQTMGRIIRGWELPPAGQKIGPGTARAILAAEGKVAEIIALLAAGAPDGE